jgi:hypothetical protein
VSEGNSFILNGELNVSVFLTWDSSTNTDNMFTRDIILVHQDNAFHSFSVSLDTFFAISRHTSLIF